VTRRSFGLILIFSGLLAACAGLPPAPQVGMVSWGGRFSLTVAPGSEAAQTWSGRFLLTDAAGTLILDLTSPLGNTLARFQTDSTGATLSLPRDGRLQVERAADARQLSLRLLGWSLPMENLPAWFSGHADPRLEAHPLLADATGNGGFSQDGWEVRLEPVSVRGTRLSLHHAASAFQPEISVRLFLEPNP
jgi:outer membrane biogenesis lipoprotein LolB